MMDVLREAAAKREQRAAAEEAAALRAQPQAPKGQCNCLAWKRRRPEPFSDLSESSGHAHPPEGIHALGPNVRAVAFGDVRGESAEQNAGLVGFYFPDRLETWDAMCGASFCGNFYHLGPGALELEARGVKRRFCNAEAAFQALKFWDRAGEFESLSGSMAFQRKRELAGQEDFTYAGFGTNWRGMWAVLQAKFRPGSRTAAALLGTGDSFLLEHNSAAGRDAVWSDNCDGEGTNWLGLQLMLLRDQLSGRRAWTDYIAELVDRDSGTPHDKRCQLIWQSNVRSARQALVDAVEEYLNSAQSGVAAQASPLCKRSGCSRPSWNGMDGEYCSRSCMAADGGGRRGASVN